MDDEHCKVCGADLDDHYTVLSDEGYPIVGSFKDAPNGRICTPVEAAKEVRAILEANPCHHRDEPRDCVLCDIRRAVGITE